MIYYLVIMHVLSLMNKVLIAEIIFVIVIIIILIYLKKIYDSKGRLKNTYQKSNLNNKTYVVQNFKNMDKAMDTLNIVHARIFILRDYLERNINQFPEYKPYIKMFCKKINKLVLQENPPGGKYTSYTINKGDEILLCIRSKESGQLHDINLIMYVVLHELAHVACPEEQHTKLFQKIFTFFLIVSINIGIYQYVNYKMDPHQYCGLTINENLLRHHYESLF